MNILVISNIWSGVRPFFYEGKNSSTGMPAFNNVFLRLLKDDRVGEVHLILWITERDKEIKLPEEYEGKIKIYPFLLADKNKIQYLLAMIRIVFCGLLLVKRHKIKRIIGFGPLAALTAIIGRLTGIKDFRRIFGSFLINEIDQSASVIFFRHPLEFLCYRMMGRGLLITNDGTKGDVVFKRFGNPKLPFHFPLNGVEKDMSKKSTMPDLNLPDEFITYVARIDNWKRQHLLIEAISILKRKGIQVPKTYIIGEVSDPQYGDQLTQSIKSNGLTDQVVHIKGLPTTEVYYMLEQSIMTFSLYQTSNLGNVFLESMQLGVPVIAINDTGSLDLIDSGAYHQLETDDPEKIADSIALLLDDASYRDQLSVSAMAFANSSIKSWDTRAKYEINLMLDLL